MSSKQARVATKHQLENLVVKLSSMTRVALKEEDAKKADEPTVNDVIEHLNAIRAGRSTKDEDVKNEFTRYYDGLDKSEKEAMVVYLKAIAQIVSGQVDAGSVVDPKNHGVETSLTGKRSKTIKPNIVKRSSVNVSSPTASGENTTAPAPIVPKKR